MKDAMTEILAAVANGEGAADEVLTTVSLGALRALVRQEPVGFRWVEAESGKTNGLLYSGEPTRIGVQRAHQSDPREVPQYVYAAPVVAGQAVPDADRLIRELKEIRDLAVHAGGPHYVLPNNERTTLTWAIDVISTLAAAKKQGGERHGHWSS